MRDILIIFGMCVIAIAIGAWLFLHDPARQLQLMPINSVPTTKPSAMEEPKEVPINFTVLDAGTQATGITTAKNYAASDSEDFAKIWKMAHADGTPLPKVDFTKDYVIGVFAGQKPTGGYALSVSKVIDSKDTRTVAITLQAPGEGCIVNQPLTSPYQIIVLPQSELALKSVTVQETKGCK